MVATDLYIHKSCRHIVKRSVNRQETGSGSKLAAAAKLSTVTQSGFNLEKRRPAARFTALHTLSLQMIQHANKLTRLLPPTLSLISEY